MKKIIISTASGLALVVGLSTGAAAQEACDAYNDGCPNVVEPESLPEVLPKVEVKPVGLPAETAVAAPAVAAKQQLPVTGSDATGLAALGATLVAGGGVLVWRSRAAAKA